MLRNIKNVWNDVIKLQAKVLLDVISEEEMNKEFDVLVKELEELTDVYGQYDERTEEEIVKESEKIFNEVRAEYGV